MRTYRRVTSLPRSVTTMITGQVGGRKKKKKKQPLCVVGKDPGRAAVGDKTLTAVKKRLPRMKTPGQEYIRFACDEF